MFFIVGSTQAWELRFWGMGVTWDGEKNVGEVSSVMGGPKIYKKYISTLQDFTVRQLK